VGHGMGGLLCREYLHKHATSLSLFRCKQILIGTPNHGTPIIYSILKTGKGSFFANHPDLSMPEDLGDLFYDLPGIYQLLPDENYGKPTIVHVDAGNFAEPIVHVDPNFAETKVKGTYIASESTHPFYTLSNDKRVNRALNFHKELNTKTFLENSTYVIYSTELETVTGVDYSNATKDTHLAHSAIGDGIVPEKSAYNLDGLITPTVKPHPDFTRHFVGVKHHALVDDERVLQCILQLILESI
jgi:hypothetical protein